MYQESAWYQQYPKLLNKPRHRVLAALNQSAALSVPATFRDGIDSGISQKSMWVGTCPVGINDSPTAFRASCEAGLACQSLTGCPSDRRFPSAL
jgi:hypothetical protein